MKGWCAVTPRESLVEDEVAASQPKYQDIKTSLLIKSYPGLSKRLLVQIEILNLVESQLLYLENTTVRI